MRYKLSSIRSAVRITLDRRRSLACLLAAAAALRSIKPNRRLQQQQQLRLLGMGLT